MKTSKLNLFLPLFLLFTICSVNALSIHNNNSKSIRVEIMDCPSKFKYSFPTDWKSDMYNNNPLRFINFLHINHVLPNGDVTINPFENHDMPSNVCIHIEGWSSWLGGVITKVRSTCEMEIHDGGFMTGIKADYLNGC